MMNDVEKHEENNHTPEEKKIAKISRNGYHLLKENRINDAIDCFTKILTLDENNNYALVGMGDASRKQGEMREAAKYYQKCLALHPDNNYALFGLADCFKTMNQHKKAIEIWERYLLSDDKNISVLTRVADSYRKMKKFPNSKDVYHRVLEIDESNAYAIIGLGHLYYDFKEYKEALFYLEKMLKFGLDKVDIRVLTSIGNCHRKLKTFSEGIPFFEAALRRESNNFYALFGLVDCYRGMNCIENIIEYCNRILEFDPKNKMILTRAGDAYRNLKDFDKAKNYYVKALDIEFDIYAILGLALILKDQEKYDEAIASLKNLIQQNSRSHRIYMELSDCYLKKGEHAKAAEILEDFEKLEIKKEQATQMPENN